MKNYFCVAINKEIVDKKVFPLKEEALAYFNERFGGDIFNDMKKTEEKIMKSIANCDKKLMKSDIESANILDLKYRREKELAKHRKFMEEVCCYYVWSYEEYKKDLFKKSDIDLLRIDVIYQKAGEKYEVAEEVYKIVSEVIENIDGASNAFERLPDYLNAERKVLLVIPEEGDNIKKIKNSIQKIKAQILAEHKKNPQLLKVKTGQ